MQKQTKEEKETKKQANKQTKEEIKPQANCDIHDSFLLKEDYIFKER
jgi:hypothetical protein